jgi:lysophospholipase L1-like esterase
MDESQLRLVRMSPCFTFLFIFLIGCESLTPAARTDIVRHGLPVWEPAMAKFDQEDQQSPPPRDPIVFVGSSTIRFWKVHEAFPGLPVLNRGFGGSQANDVVDYYDRLIRRYRPRTIVFYSGDNDLASGKAPEQVIVSVRELMRLIRRDFPQTRVILIGVKPSPSRWGLIDEMRETNRGIQRVASTDRNTIFFDPEPSVLGPDGRPRAELFRDGLHFNERGYDILNDAVRPLLR